MSIAIAQPSRGSVRTHRPELGNPTIAWMPLSRPWAEDLAERVDDGLPEVVPRAARPDGECEGAMTMKLTASMMLNLDGVDQGPGGPEEDRRGGFARGGWTAADADS